MSEYGVVEDALQAKHNGYGKNKNKKKKNKKHQPTNGENAMKSKAGNSKGNYLPCKHYGKKGHPPFKCWRRPDAKCNKCNQLGHEAVICRSKNQQPEVEAQVVEEDVEDQLFVATCFSSSSSSECWLIDSGCTNHMTRDRELFMDLKPAHTSKVTIDNGDHSSERKWHSRNTKFFMYKVNY